MGSERTFTTLGAIAAKEGYGLVDGPFGSSLPASLYTSVGVPVIRGSNLTLGKARFISDGFVFVSADTAGRLKRSLCKPLDIIFTKKGTLGQTGLIPEQGPYPSYLVSSNQMKLTVDRDLADPEFVYYYVSSPGSISKIIRDAEATGVPKTNLAYLRDFPIVLPSLSEQKEIAHILGSLDNKLDLNRRMNETLEAMAQALFKSWFVDFDPVRAKVEGRATGLPKKIVDLFPDSFVESALGEIPAGWRAVPLPDAVEVNPTRALRSGTLAPYLDMTNMPTRGHSPDQVVERPFGSGMKFKNGDTLMARITPCLENGKTSYVDFLALGVIGWGSTEYIVLRPKPPLPEEFGYLLARSERFREYAIQRMAGTSGRQRVPAEALSHYLLAVPPAEVATCFGAMVRPMFERSSAATREMHALAALRDALLPELISGKLQIPGSSST